MLTSKLTVGNISDVDVGLGLYVNTISTSSRCIAQASDVITPAVHHFHRLYNYLDKEQCLYIYIYIYIYMIIIILVNDHSYKYNYRICFTK